MPPCTANYEAAVNKVDRLVTLSLVCEQALHLGKSREVTREQHAKGDASARAAHSRVLSRLTCLAIKYIESLLAQAAKVNLKSHDVTVMMV